MSPGAPAAATPGMTRLCRDRQDRLLVQGAQKLKTRYATLGFGDEANLDEGAMWPTAYALTGLPAAEGARIGAPWKRAGT